MTNSRRNLRDMSILVLVFAVVLVGTRFVSLASVMSALLYPLFLHAFAPAFPLGVAMAVVEGTFVVVMHRANLKRIWNYEESKVDFSKLKRSKKKKAEEPTPPTSEDGGKHDEQG